MRDVFLRLRAGSSRSLSSADARVGGLAGDSRRAVALMLTVCAAAFGATTQVSLAASGRGYELVSPPDKHGAEIAPAGPHTAAESGNALFFSSKGVFGNAPSNGGHGYFLARRTATGWVSTSIHPPIEPIDRPPRTVFYALSPDLSESLLLASDFAATPGAPQTDDLYLRHTVTGGFSLVTTDAPAEPERRAFPVAAWASSDLEHVVFSNGLAGDRVHYDPSAPAHAMYYAHNSVMSFASLVPDESTAEPGDEIPAPSAQPGAGTALSRGGAQRAISEDGSRIIFTASALANGVGVGGDSPTDEAQVYVRKDHGTPDAETVRVSAPEEGVVDPLGTWAAWYRTASTDGSRIFFTSCQKLTADSTADASAGNDGVRRCDPTLEPTKADLYLYDEHANGGAGDLIDITTADPINGADVRGVLGASANGDRIYFVATGLLDPDEVGGDSGAVAGEPSIYLWAAGEGVEHVARIDSGDSSVWATPIDLAKDSRVTPDARHLAFASRRQIDPSYDNAGHSQVYLYDAGTDTLACASCVGSGPATADSTLGTQATTIKRPDSAAFEKRNLVDDGSVLFFESGEGIAPDDSNGEVDVYQYTTGTDAVELVSNGVGSSGSHFVDATPGGSSAFFTTRERLVGWDTDGSVDIYAARIGGGFEEPAPPGDCGDECQGVPAAVPPLAGVATNDVFGPGNVESERGRVSIRRLTKSQRARFARSGRIVLKVKTSKPGRIVVRWNRGKTVSTRVAKATTKRIVLRLSRKARKQLRRRNRLRVLITVTFDGAQNEVAVVLRRPR